MSGNISDPNFALLRLLNAHVEDQGTVLALAHPLSDGPTQFAHGATAFASIKGTRVRTY